ncbi:hypothetical protein VTJ04DRAFT_1072 [Mycothermus thermophilus]|uniref:uncharacterized protein n=1 Tax=Humicola insolens TaxID=85995 RepID=UPI003743DFEA
MSSRLISTLALVLVTGKALVAAAPAPNAHGHALDPTQSSGNTTSAWTIHLPTGGLPTIVRTSATDASPDMDVKVWTTTTTPCHETSDTPSTETWTATIQTFPIDMIKDWTTITTPCHETSETETWTAAIQTLAIDMVSCPPQYSTVLVTETITSTLQDLGPIKTVFSHDLKKRQSSDPELPTSTSTVTVTVWDTTTDTITIEEPDAITQTSTTTVYTTVVATEAEVPLDPEQSNSGHAPNPRHPKTVTVTSTLGSNSTHEILTLTSTVWTVAYPPASSALLEKRSHSFIVPSDSFTHHTTIWFTTANSSPTDAASSALPTAGL